LQGCQLGLGVDLGVAVCRGQVGVSEPAADHVDLDTGFELVKTLCLVSAEAVCGRLRVAIELSDPRVGVGGAVDLLCCFLALVL
jgi:hypothetical protein